jgi:hypothetical protein
MLDERRRGKEHGAGTNLVALRIIAEEAPRIFADQARSRIAEAAVAHYRAGRVKVDARIVHGAPEVWFKPGGGAAEWFEDHPHCRSQKA